MASKHYNDSWRRVINASALKPILEIGFVILCFPKRLWGRNVSFSDLARQSFGAKRISWQIKGVTMYTRTSKVKEMWRWIRLPVTSWILANVVANKKHKLRVKKEMYTNIFTSIVSLKFSILTFRVNAEKITTRIIVSHMYPTWIPNHTKKVFWSLVSQSNTLPTTLYGGLKSTSNFCVFNGSTATGKGFVKNFLRLDDGKATPILGVCWPHPHHTWKCSDGERV